LTPVSPAEKPPQTLAVDLHPEPELPGLRHLSVARLATRDGLGLARDRDSGGGLDHRDHVVGMGDRGDVGCRDLGCRCAHAVGEQALGVVTGMRSFVVEPMQYGRLFLAGGRSAHRSADRSEGAQSAMADVGVLAEVLVAWYRAGNAELLDAYSATCLRRVWRAEHFPGG
jgi:hypothetical protein